MLIFSLFFLERHRLFTFLAAFSSSAAWVRFINNNQELRLDNYFNIKESESLNQRTSLNKYKVMSEFRGGTTIVLNHLHERWEPIRKLCHHLEQVCWTLDKGQCLSYPSNAQGFGAHFDAHDVFYFTDRRIKICGKSMIAAPLSPLPKKIHLFLGPLNPPYS